MLIKVLYGDHIRVSVNCSQLGMMGTLKSRCLDLGRDCNEVILIAVANFLFIFNSSRSIENLNVADTIASQLGVDNLMSSFL